MVGQVTRRCFVQGCASVGALGLSGMFGCEDAGERSEGGLSSSRAALTRQVEPLLDRIPLSADPGVPFSTVSNLVFGGPIGERVTATQHNWLIALPRIGATPEIADLLVNRSGNPSQMWEGEYVGKYLIGALQVYRITRNEDLAASLELVVTKVNYAGDLPRGPYIGPWARDPSVGLYDETKQFRNWDLWGHYLAIVGLYEFYRVFKDAGGTRAAVAEAALSTATDVAGLISQTFVGAPSRPDIIGTHQVPADFFDPFHATNEAIGYAMALLQQHAPGASQMAILNLLISAWSATTPITEAQRDDRLNKDTCGRFLTDASQNIPFYNNGRRRWESLPSLQTLGELYYISGSTNYRTAFRHFWESIRTRDVKAHGGFSSLEEASGNPYDPRPTETCATVAWMALCIDKLRIDGVPDEAGATRAADLLELATFNAVMGSQSPECNHFVYDTEVGGIPVDGQVPPRFSQLPQDRKATFHGERRVTRYDLHWQGYAHKAQDLSCCSANGPRGLGCLSEWAVMQGRGTTGGPSTVVVNYYGPSTFKVAVPAGTLTLQQETSYPYGTGTISLRVTSNSSSPIRLALRIPEWAAGATATVGGAATTVTAGRYLMIQRVWVDVTIVLTLPMSVRRVDGGPAPARSDPQTPPVIGSTTGRAVLYRGPILLSYDERFNYFSADPAHPNAAQRVPVIQAGSGLSATPTTFDARLAMTFAASVDPGTRITLCDYGSAGQAPPSRVSTNLITSRAWQFWRRRDSGAPGAPVLLADRVVFSMGGGVAGTLGTISGVAGTNERFWSLDADQHLLIHNSAGVVTTRFLWGATRNGRRLLRGPFANPNIVHELGEIDSTVSGKMFQLIRTNDDAALGIHVFAADGTLRPLPFKDPALNSPDWNPDPTNPRNANESRWAMEGANLVLRDASGNTTSRFTRIQAERGRMTWVGASTINTSLVHQLIEFNNVVSNRVFRFSNASGAIANRVRLIPRAAGNYLCGLPASNVNEASWSLDANGMLQLVGQSGSATTKFYSVKVGAQGVRYRGAFIPNSSFVHTLEEVEIDWGPHRSNYGGSYEQWVEGERFISWLSVV